MADDANIETATSDKPLDHLDQIERDLDEKPDQPAASRLRAFEDEHFGADAVRINDRIERGSGSPYAEAAPEIRAHHAAIEKLIETEQNLSDAEMALATAEEAHGRALAVVEAGLHVPAE